MSEISHPNSERPRRSGVIAIGNRRSQLRIRIKVGTVAPSRSVTVLVRFGPEIPSQLLTPRRAFVATPALDGALNCRVCQPPTRESQNY